MKTLIACLMLGTSLSAHAFDHNSTFDSALKEWNQAKTTSAPDLGGKWIRTGVVEHTLCKNVMRGSAYAPAGIQNRDGSVFTLNFSGHQVTFENVGGVKHSQGPYEVKASDAHFSSWAYDEAQSGEKEITDQAYGEYNCRLLDEKDQLLCAVGARLKPGADSDKVFRACSQLPTGLVLLFQKIN